MGKILCIALALSAYSVSLSAQEIKLNPDGSVSITITKEQAQECKASGGCTLISMRMIEALLYESAKQMCGKRI